MEHLLVGNGINIQFNHTDYTTQSIVLRILEELRFRRFSKQCYSG
ncbi:hypothetical protein [Clostridium beijerinckii]|nr:hypothetical protein [Clostridium beijerinckii]